VSLVISNESLPHHQRLNNFRSSLKTNTARFLWIQNHPNKVMAKKTMKAERTKVMGGKGEKEYRKEGQVMDI
jgi:hypothetical protein